MTPHACEDVMQFDVNCRERQEARYYHLEEPPTVPRHLRRDLPGYLCRASGSIEIVTCIILRGNPSHDRQRESDQRI